jgi:hypothetical protein
LILTPESAKDHKFPKPALLYPCYAVPGRSESRVWGVTQEGPSYQHDQVHDHTKHQDILREIKKVE